MANSSDTNIDANEFKIISTEKLLEIKKLLEEIIEAGNSTSQKLEIKDFN